MREIKFRAIIQPKYGKKFIENSSSWVSLAEFFEHLERNYKGCYELSQYTGLKDKNGKEIYEGDIVEEYQGMDEVYFHEIKWDEDSLSYIFHELSLSDNLMVWDINTSALKVIGNIYEHPHLLGEGA